MHVDFVRVRMDVAIQTTVVLELVGADDAPGTQEGGVLEQTLRELSIEALPGEVPEAVQLDASHLEAGATVHVSDIKAPQGVTILDEPETVVASITPSAWPVIALVGWVLLLAAAVFALCTWRRWKSGGRRYRTGDDVPAHTDGPVDAIDSWDDLSRGTDPTR